MKRLSEVACDLFHPIGVFFGLKKMNNVRVFNFKPVAYSVRTVLSNSDVWFVAKDVCDALGLYDVSKACSRLDDDEKGTNKVLTLGGEQSMLTVNESGLYNLIFTSNKPDAKAFRKWVTSEVLPAIRKTGKYEVKPRITIAYNANQNRLDAVFCLLKSTIEKHGIDVEDDGKKAIHFEYFRPLAYRLLNVSHESKRKVFKRAIRKLVNNGKVLFYNDYLWLS